MPSEQCALTIRTELVGGKGDEPQGRARIMGKLLLTPFLNQRSVFYLIVVATGWQITIYDTIANVR
jgi:hypothetical protein